MVSNARNSPIDGLTSFRSVGKRKLFFFPPFPTLHYSALLLRQFGKVSTTETGSSKDRDQGMVNQAQMRFQSKQAKWPTSTKKVSGKKLAPEQAHSLDMRSQGPFRRGSDAAGR